MRIYCYSLFHCYKVILKMEYIIVTIKERHVLDTFQKIVAANK